MRNYSSTAVQTELVGAITNVATSATVAADNGFPATPFTLVIDPDTVNEEIITVTARSGTNLSTIVRGQDGTTAVAHSDEAVVKHMVTARDLQEAQNHIEATTDIHGVTGSLAGASNTMTFSNKTISGANNTLQDIAQGSVTGLTSALNAKAPIANPTFTGTVVLPSTTSIGNVSSTEINYLDGVTSAVQTQINDLQTDIDDVAAELLGLDAIVSDVISNVSAVETSLSQAVPSGVVQAYLGTSAPTGWLFCDGAAISRTTYSALFSLFGTRYGSGDGSTTFNLPDLRSRFIRGAAATNSLSGSTSGADSHTHTGSAISSGGHTHTYSGTVDATASAQRDVASGGLGSVTYGHQHAYSGTTATGGTHSHSLGVDSSSNIPVNLGLNWIVKA